MKKIIVILMALVMFCLTFTGCIPEKAVPIEDYIWEITTVQANADGHVAACSEEFSDVFPDAAVVEMICAAKNGEITINCSTTDEVVTGYYASTESGEATVYALKLDIGPAAAVTSFTTYEDGSRERTLIIDTGSYTLNFSAPE